MKEIYLKDFSIGTYIYPEDTLEEKPTGLFYLKDFGKFEAKSSAKTKIRVSLAKDRRRYYEGIFAFKTRNCSNLLDLRERAKKAKGGPVHYIAKRLSCSKLYRYENAPYYPIVASDALIEYGWETVKSSTDTYSVPEIPLMRALLVKLLLGQLFMKPEILACKITGLSGDTGDFRYGYSFHFSTDESLSFHIGIDVPSNKDGYLEACAQNGNEDMHYLFHCG